MSTSRTTPSGMPWPLVDTDWLAGQLGAKDLRILDCSVVMVNKPDGSYTFEHARANWEAGHIPGSQYVDVMNELSDPKQALNLMMPPVAEFTRILAERGVGDGTRVVLYDSSNHAWAARVWWMLRVCGFNDAAVLNGGYKKWTAESRPQSAEKTDWPKATFTAHPQPELMVSKQQVLNVLNDKDVTLINALSPQSFNGEVQLFPRPGRIPGSKNVFCQLLVDPETNAYIAPDAQRALFLKTGAFDTKRVITYCGGGIAASSDALALTLLGVENVAVYDGSMSEWTADPDTPMELP